MGFSLECFFRDLREIIHGVGTPWAKYKHLKRIIEEGYRYAKQCGKIH